MKHSGIIRRTVASSSSARVAPSTPPPQQTVTVTINAPQPAHAPRRGSGSGSDDDEENADDYDDDDFGISTYGNELALYDDRKCVKRPPWYEGVMALVFIDNDYVNNVTLSTLTETRKQYTTIIKGLEKTKRALKKTLYDAEKQVQDDMAQIASLLAPHANEIVKLGANLDRLRMSPAALMKISDLKSSIMSNHNKSYGISARIAAMDRRIRSFENVRNQFTANIDVIIDANYAEYLARTSKNLQSAQFAMIVERANEQNKQAVKNVQENIAGRTEVDVNDEILADAKALDPSNLMPEMSAPNPDSWFGEAIKAAMAETLRHQPSRSAAEAVAMPSAEVFLPAVPATAPARRTHEDRPSKREKSKVALET